MKIVTTERARYLWGEERRSSGALKLQSSLSARQVENMSIRCPLAMTVRLRANRKVSDTHQKQRKQFIYIFKRSS